MASEHPLVRTAEQTEVLAPSNRQHPTVVIHVHHHHPPAQIVYQQPQRQPQSDDWAKVVVGGLFAVAAAAVGPILADIYKTNVSPPSYNSQRSDYSSPSDNYSTPVQEPVQNCWWEPRRKYLGRECAYVKTGIVPNEYGGRRAITHRQCAKHYRKYKVRVCS